MARRSLFGDADFVLVADLGVVISPEPHAARGDPAILLLGLFRGRPLGFEGAAAFFELALHTSPNALEFGFGKRRRKLEGMPPVECVQQQLLDPRLGGTVNSPVAAGP